jgi:hypothetical protein
MKTKVVLEIVSLLGAVASIVPFAMQIAKKVPGNPFSSHRVVVVLNGASLSGLAIKYYGSDQLWPLLWDANRDVIGDNPNLLMPGMVLQIPPISSFTEAEQQNARQRFGTWRVYPHHRSTHGTSGRRRRNKVRFHAAAD